MEKFDDICFDYSHSPNRSEEQKFDDGWLFCSEEARKDYQKFQKLAVSNI